MILAQEPSEEITAMPFRSALAGLTLLLALSPLLAQTAEESKLIAPREPLRDKWLAGLQETDQKLKAHQWEAAAKRGRQAGEQIVDLAGTGESPAYSLAVADVFRAIAEAELGQQAEAEWLWDSALNLFPDVAKTNLAPYGEKALGLRQRTLRILDKQGKPADPGKDGEKPAFDFADKNVERPRIVHQTPLEYPKALQLLGVEGWVIVASVIGEDGRPRQPVILDAKGGGASTRYLALDTLRQWRFEPAKVAGKPVAVSYVLTVNFKRGRS
jgi:TonB family protein